MGNVRYMVERDLNSVLRIGNQSFESFLSKKELNKFRKQKDNMGMVSEQDNTIRGFMIYEKTKQKICVLKFAVDPDFRRQGIGKGMVDNLIKKLLVQERTKILLSVRESNLPAQQFFREQGFKAIRVLRDFYEDTSEDAYLMKYGIDDRIK